MWYNVQRTMRYADEDRCAEYGLDAKRVESIARRLSSAAKDARKLGLVVFGGSGTGTLRITGADAWTVVADLDGPFDGGDGGDFDPRHTLHGTG